jgi:hypothetical protein
MYVYLGGRVGIGPRTPPLAPATETQPPYLSATYTTHQPLTPTHLTDTTAQVVAFIGDWGPGNRCLGNVKGVNIDLHVKVCALIEN